MDKLLTYKYYDTPEGQDIFLKTIVTSKYATITGLGAATFDVLMYSHPKGFVNTAGRFMWFIGPLVGMATAFTVTANAAQNFRGKNDKLNYFLGGAAAGTVLSAWHKRPILTVPSMVLLGIAAVVKKLGVDGGWVYFPDIVQATKTIQSVRHDWTMVKDIEEMKNWTTGSEGTK